MLTASRVFSSSKTGRRPVLLLAAPLGSSLSCARTPSTAPSRVRRCSRRSTPTATRTERSPPPATLGRSLLTVVDTLLVCSLAVPARLTRPTSPTSRPIGGSKSRSRRLSPTFPSTRSSATGPRQQPRLFLPYSFRYAPPSFTPIYLCPSPLHVRDFSFRYTLILILCPCRGTIQAVRIKQLLDQSRVVLNNMVVTVWRRAYGGIRLSDNLGPRLISISSLLSTVPASASLIALNGIIVGK